MEKDRLAFSNDRIYIMQRDDPMSTPIPRLTDYEDVEIMIVARPLRGEECSRCRQRPQEHHLYRVPRTRGTQGQGSMPRARP